RSHVWVANRKVSPRGWPKRSFAARVVCRRCSAVGKAMMRRCCRSWGHCRLNAASQSLSAGGLAAAGRDPRTRLASASNRGVGQSRAQGGVSCTWRCPRFAKNAVARDNGGGLSMIGLKRALLRAGFAALVALAAHPAGAQGDAAANFPNRPIRLIVGFAAGGNDLFARLVGQKLSDNIGQPVIIENKPGA